MQGATNIDDGDEKDKRMTTLIIRAINSAQNKKMAVSDIYQKVLDLNPALKSRSSDWQGTIRHILSTSTLFVLDNESRPGQWKIDPNGERSTHKNRKRKNDDDSGRVVQHSSLDKSKKEKKRLGTTKRSGEGGSIGWPSKFFFGQRRGEVIVNNESAAMPPSTTPFLSLSDEPPFQYFDDITSLPLSSNYFVQKEVGQQSTTIAPALSRPRTLPNQIIDTALEPFPPMPRLDTWHHIHSQSSSITLSQSQSQSQ